MFFVSSGLWEGLWDVFRGFVIKKHVSPLSWPVGAVRGLQKIILALLANGGGGLCCERGLRTDAQRGWLLWLRMLVAGVLSIHHRQKPTFSDIPPGILSNGIGGVYFVIF